MYFEYRSAPCIVAVGASYPKLLKVPIVNVIWSPVDADPLVVPLADDEFEGDPPPEQPARLKLSVRATAAAKPIECSVRVRTRQLLCSDPGGVNVYRTKSGWLT
jgi:hypothetical protein